MENKYYTPEIEEFHVGFEYEMLQKSEWIKDTYLCNSKLGVTFDDMPELAKLSRVKYLDREDIESLGFEKDLGERYRRKVDDNLIYNIIEIVPYYTMRQDERENLVRIYFIKQINDFEQLARSEIFRGDIKNKSELKKVLKMIGL
jgi:hypothetical protein